MKPERPNVIEFTEKVLAFLGTMGVKNVTKPKFYVEINFDEPYISDDKLGLFAKTPTIDQIPELFREAEKKLGVTFPRVAFVRTNLAGGKEAIAEWVKTL